MPDAYAFSEPWADRITDAVRAVEGDNRQDNQPPKSRQPQSSARHVTIVTVTSLTTTHGFYPCSWCTTTLASSGTPAITFTETGDTGWAYALNGLVPKLSNEYHGLFCGLKPNDSKAVFLIEESTTTGFTGTKLVCEGDGTLHTWTFTNGVLITAP